MLVFEQPPNGTIPIDLVSSSEFEQWHQECSDATKSWVKLTNFRGKANQFFHLPDSNGNPTSVVAGIGDSPSKASLGLLSQKLGEGDFCLRTAPQDDLYTLALGWGMGAYTFDKYKTKASKPEKRATLYVDPQFASVQDEVDAINLARDLINTGAGDMLPDELEDAVTGVCKRFSVDLSVTRGDELLERGFRTIHTVGRASKSPPRLMEFRWGDENAPKITIMGKGVCFDSGGLDLKNAQGMRDMKKDMAGSAMALGLSQLIMARKLNVRMRLMIPAVENAVSDNAYRPGDVITTYKGTTVEVGNTDAEGRLILCDALALAAEEKPEFMLDFATLTAAARVALGFNLPAMFSNNDSLAEGLVASSKATSEPIWRMPLFDDYRETLKSSVADICNISSMAAGGAITAALFLEHFVDKVPWVHFDLMGSNTKTRPAHPAGGEGSVIRAAFHYIENRFNG